MELLVDSFKVGQLAEAEYHRASEASIQTFQERCFSLAISMSDLVEVSHSYIIKSPINSDTGSTPVTSS